MSNLTEHAKTELEAAGLFDEDSDYGGLIGEAVMELMEKFAEQGHSGFSASLCISVFSKVAAFQPLVPLNGEDDEWIDVDGKGTFQNRRCSHVFKENGSAYDIDGKVFREPNGLTYTSFDSRVPVTFPYSPHTEYVDVPAPEEV